MKKLLDFKNKKNYMTYIILGILIWLIAFTLYNTYKRDNSPQFKQDTNMQAEINTKLNNNNYEKIVLAGGCFWCTEAEFNHKEGVISAISGYADSNKENPNYEEVGSGTVRAREAVEVIYDVSKINISQILEIYFKHFDPTDEGGSFGDRGYQYTSAIYYTNENQKNVAISIKNKLENSNKLKAIDTTKNKIATDILPFVNFYPAEEYHQDYKDKNPIRYNGYREASGRNNFIRLHWQDGSTTTREIFDLKKDINLEKNIKVNEIQNKNNLENNNMLKDNWNNFTPEIKASKLKTLTSLQYGVTQNDDTEKPFANEYNGNKEVGIYVDIVSGEPLFLSKDKYNSGTGWPSFVKPINEDYVRLNVDDGFFNTRTEVRSKIADSHLGHVFDDGPKDQGGKRYCMNSASLRFVKFDDMEMEGYVEYVYMLK